MTERYRVKRHVPMEGGLRVLLYFWSHDTAPRIRNLVCLDAADNLVWQAELPTSDLPDCFVSLEREGDKLAVRTYRGHHLSLCVKTGSMLT